MGIPPATLASIARLMPAAIALSHNSAPCLAINSLLAVTIDFLLSMAASMMLRATSVPPTSSATISTSGCDTTSRQSRVRTTSLSDSSGLISGFAAANNLYLESKSELQRNLIRVLGKDIERAESDIAKPHNAGIHFVHNPI